MPNYNMIGVDPEIAKADNNMELLVATHPAQPGTSVAYAYKDGTSHTVAVVLWGVLRDGTPVPITLSGVWDGVSNRNIFVLHPDGTCSTFDQSWRSLAEAVEELKAFDEI